MFFSSPLCRSNDQVGRDVWFFSLLFSFTLPNQRSEESSCQRPARGSPTPSLTLTLGLRVLGANHHREPFFFFFFFATALLLHLHPVWSPPDSRGHGGEARRSWALCRDQTAAKAEKIWPIIIVSPAPHAEPRFFIPFSFHFFSVLPPGNA